MKSTTLLTLSILLILITGCTKPIAPSTEPMPNAQQLRPAVKDTAYLRHVKEECTKCLSIGIPERSGQMSMIYGFKKLNPFGEESKSIMHTSLTHKVSFSSRHFEYGVFTDGSNIIYLDEKEDYFGDDSLALVSKEWGKNNLQIISTQTLYGQLYYQYDYLIGEGDTLYHWIYFDPNPGDHLLKQDEWLPLAIKYAIPINPDCNKVEKVNCFFVLEYMGKKCQCVANWTEVEY